MSNVRLEGAFTLRSPLSHIGETISTTAYLAQEPILQPDGSLAEVAVYSGNAWRGHLRDCAASYMLERIGSPRLTLDAFHLLFSGGRIAGDQKYDVERARSLRQLVPMVSLWGGGIGSQILAGKLRVSNCYPLCREAIPVLAARWHDRAAAVGYGALTTERSYSRRDDSKIDTLNHHIAPPAGPAPGLLDAPAPRRPRREAREDKPVADQMRMTVEVLCAGAVLSTKVDLLEVTEVELGAFVSAVHGWSRSPHIGGQSSRGLGEADLSYEMVDLDTGARQPFLAVTDGVSLLAPPAAAARDSYDRHLRDTYDRMLDERGQDMRALLTAAP